MTNIFNVKGIHTENDNRQTVIYARVSTRNQDEVMEQKIKTILVTHKDRFVRSGYDWFDYRHRKSLYRILFQSFMYSLIGCMDFVSIKNK